LRPFPAQGDVTPWLELLEQLIPDRPTRQYALHWLALKVQIPGNVQRTILIFTGAKGTGKNSLVEPIVRFFGSAGRVFDDAEQVAGRFTGHMMTVAFAVLDEALFAGDPKQADRVKARVTATSTTYEAKGRDPVVGVNRCAYVSLSNHTHVWQATIDERRAVVIETGNSLIGNSAFWSRYYEWLAGAGPAALLHYLQAVDLTGFDVGAIPRTEALRRQVEQTALRSPAAAWWYAVLDEGAVTLRDGSNRRRFDLALDGPTAIDKEVLRLAFEEATRTPKDWPHSMKQLRTWAGGLRELRPRGDGTRGRAIEFPSVVSQVISPRPFHAVL
jgi:molybdopterin-guanine dinucleotide biosynthesis protein